MLVTEATAAAMEVSSSMSRVRVERVAGGGVGVVRDVMAWLAFWAERQARIMWWVGMVERVAAVA